MNSTLAAGARLGSYEILALVGAGGMGEVYKARDTRLDRNVAIKILPDALAADPQFRERFDREARALSRFETRCARASAKGSGLPLDEALRIAIQMADALAAAHRQGIVHRDLKPGNVKVRPDGTVKVLDFGLAKAMDRSEGDGFSRRQADAEAPALRTITSPAVTGAGHDPRHVPIHGARAGGGRRSGRTHRPLRVRQRALRDDRGEEGVRGQDADESSCRNSRARPTAAHHRAAARAPTRRLHRPQVPGEKPGRPLADRVRFGIGPALGRGRREREHCGRTRSRRDAANESAPRCAGRPHRGGNPWRGRDRPCRRRASYAVTANGQGFLVNTVVDQPTRPALTVILNWTAGLKK